MSFRAPLSDIKFTLNQVAGVNGLLERGMLENLDRGLLAAILEEAGKFAEERIAPINREGDIIGAQLKNGNVSLPDSWRETYRDWSSAGWAAVSGPEQYGGQALPISVAMACLEIWTSASLSFALNPLLTQAAVNAIDRFASEELKSLYLEKMVSGVWSGTMQLTEPQAGSDLNNIRTSATPQADGSYLIKGTKIFISYGDHSLTENIIHMVLARTPESPPGTKGISLFLVPKYLLDDDGSTGSRNDVVCSKVEHKLGIHASPTCVMNFGESSGAVGWLVGQEHMGLVAMFTMMNEARLGVGIQGVSIAERATQQAIAYANERKQGRNYSDRSGNAEKDMDPIIQHPDVRRMLLTMKAKTAAARAICYMTAKALDLSRYGENTDEKTAAAEKAGLLTPVAKAYSTDISVEVASSNIQVHGGMGYMEETGAAQLFRDARITPIYEGTNGIQAIDLVTRKLPLNNGKIVRQHIDELWKISEEVSNSNHNELKEIGNNLTEAVNSLESATNWLLDNLETEPDGALSGATPYLRLFGVVTGGVYLAKGALEVKRSDLKEDSHHILLARYFAENLIGDATGLTKAVTGGYRSILSNSAELLLNV